VLLVGICLFEIHGTCDFVRTQCTPDSDFKVIQRKWNECYFRNASACCPSCLHSTVMQSVLFFDEPAKWALVWQNISRTDRPHAAHLSRLPALLRREVLSCLALAKPGGTCLFSGTQERYTRYRQLPYILLIRTESQHHFNLLKPIGHVMHQQFNIQQLYALPTLYLCVLYLSENKQRPVPITA